VDQHHPASTDAAHLGIDHALDESGGDRGVHGVSAAPHHLETYLRRLRLRADDDGHRRQL
jgi:hypothetical protein